MVAVDGDDGRIAAALDGADAGADLGFRQKDDAWHVCRGTERCGPVSERGDLVLVGKVGGGGTFCASGRRQWPGKFCREVFGGAGRAKVVIKYI